MSTTGDRLAEVMGERGVDQAELARQLDVSQGTISKIVVGRTRNSRLLPKIAAKLGVPVNWLLGETDQRDDAEYGTGVSHRLNYEQLELVDCFDRMDRANQLALLQMARALPKREAPLRERLHEKPIGFRAERRSEG